MLCITPYDNLDHAISLANDSDYGLSGYVGASDHETAISIARRLHWQRFCQRSDPMRHWWLKQAVGRLRDTGYLKLIDSRIFTNAINNISLV